MVLLLNCYIVKEIHSLKNQSSLASKNNLTIKQYSNFPYLANWIK